MSEEVTNKLLGDLTNANAEAKKRKLQLRQMSEQLKKVTEEHQAALKELEGLRKNPSALSEEVNKLRGELRTRDHRGAFEKAAKEMGVKESALEDLWHLSGYKADGDAVDVEALKVKVQESLANRPYFLADKDKAPEKLAPGPGVSKGGFTEAVSFVVRKSDCTNPEYMRTNGAKIADASRNGTLKFVD